MDHVKFLGVENEVTKMVTKVSKSDKSYYVCMIRLKSLLAKNEKYGTLPFLHFSIVSRLIRNMELEDKF